MSEAEPVKPANTAAFWIALFWGVLSGWVVIFLPYLVVLAIRTKGLAFLLSGTPEWIYNGSLLLLMPLLQGFVGALMRGPQTRSVWSGGGMIVLIWFIDTALAAVFMREGIICLIMAIPLLWPVIAIGYGIGRVVARWKKSRMVSVSLLPLALVWVVGETQGPAPDYRQAIVDTVTVNAPPEYIWRYVVDYPDNPNPPDYWLWKVGLPAPTHSVAPIQAVGAHRECKFSGDKAFEERIAELEPNRKLTFVITKQPQHPEIIGHINVDKGQIELKANGDGTTTLIATSWYRLHVRPAAYFDLWAADVTRHIHFRVLGYMKELAERDYAAAQGRAKAAEKPA